MCSWPCTWFCEDPQVLSTAVVTEKRLQQARKITADNQNHYKNNPFLTCLTAQHWNSWIKCLKISNDHKWQRYMVYWHAHFPNIALLVLTTAVVEVFFQVQYLSQTTLPRTAALLNTSFLTFVISQQTGNESFSQAKMSFIIPYWDISWKYCIFIQTSHCLIVFLSANCFLLKIPTCDKSRCNALLQAVSFMLH